MKTIRNLYIAILAAALLLCAAACRKTDPLKPLPPVSSPDTQSGAETRDSPAVPSDRSEDGSETSAPCPDDPTTATDSENTPEPTTSDGGTPSEEPPRSLSGVFSSDTGTSLNLSVSYTLTEAEDGGCLLHAEVYLDSYALYCSSRANCNHLRVQDRDLPFSTGPMAFDDGTGRHHTELYRADVLLSAEELGDTLYISASWLFNGSYSKIEIGEITAQIGIPVNF